MEPVDKGDAVADGERASFVDGLWVNQDAARLAHEKQVEENVRMLSGQQWMVFSDLLNQWVDVSEYLTDDEKRWRQRPVVNRLLYWYMLTHARMTENPPIVSFQPATGDRMDARLADSMDTIYKTLWREMGMNEVQGRFMSWVIAAGRGYMKTRVDLQGGELREWLGPATVTVETEDGEQDVFVPVAPYNYDENGEVVPQVDVRRNGNGFEFEQTGEPFTEREGALCVDVLSPLEVRGSWGPNPWHKKRWHLQKSLLTPEEVYDTWGVECEPDTNSSEAGSLEQLLFGAGYYGAAGNRDEAGMGTQPNESTGYVTVYEFWHKPTSVVPGMEAGPQEPGGRLLVTTPNKVLRDGPRPVKLPYTSPIRKLDFVNIPGRPSGTTPLEMLNPIQRAYNRGVAQIMEHRNLVTNPIALVDETSGIEKDQITNRPGQILEVTKQPNVPPLEYAAPPQLSEDVWQTQAMLQDEMAFLGNLEGAEGAPPTRDPSGELVKELRFNSDRFIGPTMRRAVQTMTRMIEDWMAFLPTVWDQEKAIEYAGEDQVVRTITVFPELFEQGQVNVNPEMESMLPQGRGERQQRVYRMWLDGAFGPPASPEARQKFMDLMNFPHMDRAAKPGGIHRTTARKENGELASGKPADEVPVAKWYNHQIHLDVHERFMSSPEFRELSKQKQEAFVAHTDIHRQQLQKQMQKQLQMQAALGQSGVGGSQGGGGGRAGGGSGGGGGEGAEGGDVPGLASMAGPSPVSQDNLPEGIGEAPTAAGLS